MSDEKLRVNQIRIENILAHDLIEISPGKVTTISGPNEAGKTSVLSAIAGLVGGGHDATLLRKGKERGEIVIWLSNGVEVRKTITPTGSRVEARHQDMGKLSSPQTFLASIVAESSFNPVRFLEASRQERLDMFLKAVRIEIPDGAIQEAVAGIKTVPQDEIATICQQEKRAIMQLGLVARRVYDARQATNRVEKEKQATASQLTAALPPEEVLATNWAETIAGLGESVNALVAATEKRRAEIQAEIKDAEHQVDAAIKDEIHKANDALKDLDAAFEKDKARLLASKTGQADAERQDAAEKIAAIERLRDQKVAAIEKRFAEEVETRRTETVRLREEVDITLRQKEAELKVAGKEAVEKIRTETQGDLDGNQASIADLRAELATATAKHEESVRAQESVKLRDKMRKEAEWCAAESERMTSALEKLESIKVAALAKTPVAGLSVAPDTGEISLNDITFDRLSEAQRVELAFLVAKAGLGKLPLMCVDGLERLNDARFAEFRKRAVAEDIQLIVTRVSNEGLSIRTEG